MDEVNLIGGKSIVGPTGAEDSIGIPGDSVIACQDPASISIANEKQIPDTSLDNT
jgi:hypothetical protein